MDLRKLRRLQSKAEGLLRKYEALIVVGNMMTADRRREFENEQKELRKHPTIKKLANSIAQKEQAISRLRNTLGVAAAADQMLLECLKFVEKAPKGKGALVPKYRVRELFTRAQTVFDRFDDFPDHARFVIHRTKPPYHVRETTVDWVCTEVLLYEDMCALFNLAKEHQARIEDRVDKRKAKKPASALVRAAASTALYFVESYLNGIAFDFYLANETKLPEVTKAALTEWNSAKNRPNHLGLRDKLLQYPRAILGALHPPLQESNCTELSYIADRGKALRDSVVHASPRPDHHTFEPEKETILFNPDFQELERIADSTITLVRKIEITVRGDDKRLFWLHDRGVDGYFPGNVFY